MTISSISQKYPIYNQFHLKTGNSSRVEHRRSTAYEHEVKTSDKIQAGVGSVVGTLIALGIIMKHQKVSNPIKLKYGLQEMIGTSAASVIGGVSVGMIGDTKEAKKK